MTEMNITLLVAVHPESAFKADQLFLGHLKLAFEPVDFSFGFRRMFCRFTIVDEARQIGRYTEVAAVGISR